MPGLRLDRVRRLVKVNAVRVHHEELTRLAILKHLRDDCRARLSLVLAAWRSKALIVDNASDARLLFHSVFPFPSFRFLELPAPTWKAKTLACGLWPGWSSPRRCRGSFPSFRVLDSLLPLLSKVVVNQYEPTPCARSPRWFPVQILFYESPLQRGRA